MNKQTFANPLSHLTFSFWSILGFTLFLSCQNTTSPTQAVPISLVNNNGVYDPPPVRTFPSSADDIQTWIDEVNFPLIRAHGWDIWESITMDTASGANFPIWESWYTGHELFEMGTDSKTSRAGFRDFEKPSQFTHNREDIPMDDAERPLAFNRFTNSVAQVIWDKEYNDSTVLKKINADFTKNNTPIGEREVSTSIDTVDDKSVVLKCVFQFISGTEPTALPYWKGNSPFYTSNQDNPEPHTWKQCVVIDPTGNLKVGATHRMKCNEVVGDWPVIDINDIYNIEITEAEADSFSEYAKESGDDLGEGNMADTTAINNMVKAGNFALLMAMHVTGKEIVNWTWQSFWWTPNPSLPPYGGDRPTSIPAPWSNYNMKTAYFMTIPNNNPVGEPHIAFNPYLETNLAGTFHASANPADTVQWKGVFSNCMSCHRLASFPSNQYTSNGFVDKSDKFLFGEVTKTDFLWSVAGRSRE